MKAEHRKELQTNSLADMLGRTVRNVRGGAGFSWFKLGIVAVVALGIFFWYVRSKNIARQEAEAWAQVDYNDDPALMQLLQASGNTKQGHAAHAMLVFTKVWETVHSLGSEKSRFQDTREILEAMKSHLNSLAEECKEDSVMAAECKYHFAVCTEALAGLADKSDDKTLSEAKLLFKDLAEGELKLTAHGVLAKRRLAQYDDPVQFAAITSFYRELQMRFRFERSLK